MSRSEHPEAPGLHSIRCPTGRDRLLLVTLLGRPAQAARAWSQWTTGLPASALVEALSRYKRTWPLVLWSARRNGLPVSRPLLTVLRAAYVSEKVRYGFLWRELEACISDLSKAGISSVALGGVPLASTVYPEPWLRHVHDVRLGVSDVAGAGLVLSARGFHRANDAPLRAKSAVALEGKRGESLLLVLADTRPVGTHLPGSHVTMQRPLDALMAAWEETLAADAYPLVWATDVFFVTRSEPLPLAGSQPMQRVSHPLLDEAAHILAQVLDCDGSPA
jgi:hypothetical protein